VADATDSETPVVPSATDSDPFQETVRDRPASRRASSRSPYDDSAARAPSLRSSWERATARTAAGSSA
jgi:hypothetical protein